ncbi:MAG: hypothetical protein JXR64_00595 [Spirochaetales bacterium]|nr:hypothetical protein [Spirochaetales bacterium]
MNILITCSLQFEFNEARNQLNLTEITSKKDIPRIAKKENITLLYTGIGKINAMSSLFEHLSKNSYDLVIDTGLAGSLNEKIEVKSIVICNQAIDFFADGYINQKVKFSEEFLKDLYSSIKITNYIVGSIETTVKNGYVKEQLIESEVDIVTWETSSIFKVCNQFNTNCLSIRAISDCCDENTEVSFKENKVELCKILYNYLKILCKSV